MITNTQIASTTTTRIYLSTGQSAVTTAIFCNTDNSVTATLNVYAVPYGLNANATTQIMKGVTLPAGETFVMDTERLILENGDALYAQASSATIITSTISSVGT